VKIKLFCEGKTEKGLAKLIREAVDANSAQRCGVGVKSFNGLGDLLKGLERRVQIEVRAGAKVVYCLVDLYHYRSEKLETENLKSKTIAEQVQLIKADIDDELGAMKVHTKVFIVVHEVETWILADTNAIKKRLKTYIPETYHNLEQEGKYNEPAKFLNDLFKKHARRSFEKIDDGTFLLEKADWQKIYNTCSVFKALVDELRSDCLKFS
jgi:hypothetical protein